MNRPERAPVASWLDPETNPPPRGVKIQLLTEGGIAVYGEWRDQGYDAWAPCMQIPAELQMKIIRKRQQQRRQKDKDKHELG